MTNELTLKDIRKALDLINYTKEPLKRVDTEWGFVECDMLGNPVNIGLNKEMQSILLDLTYHNTDKLVGEVSEVFGIKVFKSKLES